MRRKPGDPNFKYSFSSINQAFECPYCFFLNKLDDDPPEKVSNIFAEIGTLTHSVLEEWCKGELTLDELSMEFGNRFDDEVVTDPPKQKNFATYRDKQFQLGVDFFDNFDGFPGFTIIGAEIPFETTVETKFGTRTIMGYIDLLMQDNNTGALIVADHKSKSMKAFREAENEMYKQLYLYSKAVHEMFPDEDRYPDFLMFHLFKENGEKLARRFDKAEYDATIAWAIEQIEEIESRDNTDWDACKKQPDNGDVDFFCQNICSYRLSCPNGTRKPKKYSRY